MATIKSYTDISQSKKLVDILPPESADMCYKCIEDDPYDIVCKPYSKWKEEYKGLLVKGDANVIPCWSLDGLIEAMPQSITKYIESERCQKTFHLNLFRSYYHCCSYCFEPSVSDNDGNNILYCIGRDNWVDACYEMVIRLHEHKML